MEDFEGSENTMYGNGHMLLHYTFIQTHRIVQHLCTLLLRTLGDNEVVM